MKHYGKPFKTSWISVMLIFSLSGCSLMLTSKMPSGSVSMEQTYNDAIQGGDNATEESSASVKQLRSQLQPLSNSSSINNIGTHTDKNQITNQISLLPNPNVVMYVYPHLVGNGNTSVPVPGYYTVFPLYTRVYYQAI